jgi:hypothetical protein
LFKGLVLVTCLVVCGTTEAQAPTAATAQRKPAAPPGTPSTVSQAMAVLKGKFLYSCRVEKIGTLMAMDNPVYFDGTDADNNPIKPIMLPNDFDTGDKLLIREARTDIPDRHTDIS